MKNQKETGPREKIKAAIRSIRYSGGDDGFFIATWERTDDVNRADLPKERYSYGKRFQAVGNIIDRAIDLEFNLYGSWVLSPKYGWQFAFQSFETLEPLDIDGIYKYLLKIPNVGPAMANLLIMEYEEDALEIMRTDPERVSQDIPRVSLDLAKGFQTHLLEFAETEQARVELGNILDVPHMRKNLADKLLLKYRGNAAKVVRENPYILIGFPGVGFYLADEVALKLGFDMNGLPRKKAGAMHCLDNVRGMKGDTWVTLSVLEATMIKEMGYVVEITAGLPELIKDGAIVEIDGRFATRQRARTEGYIAYRIAEMIVPDELRGNHDRNNIDGATTGGHSNGIPEPAIVADGETGDRQNDNNESDHRVGESGAAQGGTGGPDW